MRQTVSSGDQYYHGQQWQPTEDRLHSKCPRLLHSHLVDMVFCTSLLVPPRCMDLRILLQTYLLVLPSCCKACASCVFTPLRAGELSAEELEQLMTIVANPRQYKIPDWFLNRQKDHKDGRFSQITSSALETKLRDDLERLKKIRWVLSGLLLGHWDGGFWAQSGQVVGRAGSLQDRLGGSA